MLAKGNRSKVVTQACQAHGGFYLGSIGGPAARLAQDCIKSVDVLEYAELGMEAVWKIEVEDFPAFIVVDDKGNDFFTDPSGAVTVPSPGSGCARGSEARAARPVRHTNWLPGRPPRMTSRGTSCELAARPTNTYDVLVARAQATSSGPADAAGPAPRLRLSDLDTSTRVPSPARSPRDPVVRPRPDAAQLEAAAWPTRTTCAGRLGRLRPGTAWGTPGTTARSRRRRSPRPSSRLRSFGDLHADVLTPDVPSTVTCPTDTTVGLARRHDLHRQRRPGRRRLFAIWQNREIPIGRTGSTTLSATAFVEGTGDLLLWRCTRATPRTRVSSTRAWRPGSAGPSRSTARSARAGSVSPSTIARQHLRGDARHGRLRRGHLRPGVAGPQRRELRGRLRAVAATVITSAKSQAFTLGGLPSLPSGTYSVVATMARASASGTPSPRQ